MVAVNPDLVEKLKITGVATDPDESLQDKTTAAIDVNPPAVPGTQQTVGFIQVRNTTRFEGVKVTWDVGYDDLAVGDTFSIFLHSLGTFPPTNSDKLVCMPYITGIPGGTVHQTTAEYLEVISPTSNAFNVFTVTSDFKANLVNLGSGKFSVRIIILDAAPLSTKRFGRWNEIDSNLTQPSGIVHQGDPDDMIGVGILDAFAGVVRDGGVVSSPGGIFGTAAVASQGGAKRDSGVVSITGVAGTASQGGVRIDSGAVSITGVAETASQGGARIDSGAVSVTGTGTVAPVVASTIRGGVSSMVGIATMTVAVGTDSGPVSILGVAVVASGGGAKRDSGAIATLGTATVASQGGAVRDSGSIASLGTATVTSEGGVKRDSGATAVAGTATIASQGGVTRDSAAISMVGVGVMASAGGKKGDVLIDGSETFSLENSFQSAILLSDGDNWWLI